MFTRLFDHPASILILVLLVIVLFGWKQLPDMARSLGRSTRILKSEVDAMKEESKDRQEKLEPKNNAIKTTEEKVVTDSNTHYEEIKPSSTSY